MSNSTAKIGLGTAVAIVVANMVGTGVFGSLGYQVADIPSGFPILVLWLLGGVLSFCGAVCYAELASMFPRNGGEYHLLGKAWSPFVGFLAGWISIAVGFAAPVAANSVLLGGYLEKIFHLTPVQAKALFSVPVVLLVMLVHLGRLTFIGKFQIFFTSAKVLLILVLGALGFFLATAQPVSFLPREGDGELILSGSFAISLVFVLYAYSGWNAATYMIDEVENPRRTVPLALLIGTGAVTLLYVFLNASFLRSTPIAEMAGEKEVGLVAARSILGAKGGMIMGLLISFGLISTISSMTWAGPRVSAAIGRDYRLFRFLQRENRNGIPWVALLAQTGIVLAMIPFEFDEIIQYVQALLTLSSLLVVIGVFWLRFTRPEAERPYRAWGYPVTPLVFAGMSVYVLYFQVWGKTAEILAGLGTLVFGTLLYFVVRAVGGKGEG